MTYYTGTDSSSLVLYGLIYVEKCDKWCTEIWV